MLIKDGFQLFNIDKDDFYRWLKHHLKGGLDGIEDHGGIYAGHIKIDLTDMDNSKLRKLVKDYESK